MLRLSKPSAIAGPLGAALLASFLLAAPALRAQDKPSTGAADPKAEEKKKELEKKLQEIADEIDKEWKDQKQDPAPAHNFFQFLLNQFPGAGIAEVGECKTLYKKIVAKKIPFADAQTGASKVSADCLDKKTTPPKFDAKKFVKDYTKWISDWKPPKPDKPAPPPPATTNNSGK